MTISAKFKSTLPSMNYVFKNGMTAVFLSGEYTTDREDLIKELAAEVGATGRGKSQHPYIYVDPDDCEIDSEALTPLEILKEQMRAEILAEQAAAVNPANNVSTTDQGKFSLSVANTGNTAAGQGGGVQSDSGAPVTMNATQMAAAIKNAGANAAPSTGASKTK